jgi:hypothetical protein
MQQSPAFRIELLVDREAFFEAGLDFADEALIGKEQETASALSQVCSLVVLVQQGRVLGEREVRLLRLFGKGVLTADL